MSKLLERLRDPGRSGVYRASGAQAIEEATRSSALDVVTIDVGASVFDAMARALEFPDWFGHNWDALADVLEDRDWLGRHGIVIALSHATAYRREHPHEWSTLEDLLREASEFWKERHAGFWIFVA